MLEQSAGVTISLVYDTLGMVAAEEPVICNVPESLVRADSMRLTARCLNSSSLPSWILSLAMA
jgi:hypothetical protein